jgi:putative ABC transport system permease protein
MVALGVGLPIAWLGMNKFLETFAYRTEINVSIFLITSTSLILVALLTVSFQSVKAGLTDPAKALKSE